VSWTDIPKETPTYFDDWLIETGRWDDDKFWMDTRRWVDSPVSWTNIAGGSGSWVDL